MIDHVLGRPSVKSRRLQVLVVLGIWTAYVFKGNKHGPPLVRVLSRALSKRLTAWQAVVITMIYLYAARNFSTLVGLASPDPLSNMYEADYFRATWMLTALDAGFWTAMKIRNKPLRDLASMVFSCFYMIAAEQADEKVRKVRSNINIDHMRVSWNKGSESPYLRFFQGLLRRQYTKWPPRQIRIPRPSASDYREPVMGWLYFDGPLSQLKDHTQIILDIPGGGFVAMDPRCNDDKLLAWAGRTKRPVLSLDYKKAPEYPYPYALNECYDVYTTIIKTRGRCIGLSGEVVPKVVITGDSAGGTLATSTTLMIIESGSSPVRRFQGQTELPVPDGLILFYPALDMNIGSWMSDEQMSLIKDRSMRATNKSIVRRKRSQYDNLVGTPYGSDDEADGEDDSAASSSKARCQPRKESADGKSQEFQDAALLSPTHQHIHSPAPEYANLGPTTWSQVQPAPPSPLATRAPTNSTAPAGTAAAATTDTNLPLQPGASHRPEPMHTRLAISSMISYFNDRVLTPEMMRAMIILYVGRHNQPDFSQDYLLSPILAPDVLLSKFPKTYFLTGERDPLVDDTVILAGRLRRVKAAVMASGGQRLEYRDSDAMTEGYDMKAVAEVVLLPGVSHGFLQFPTVYKPAWQLFEQSAEWAVDLFNDAERKESDRVWATRGRQMGRLSDLIPGSGVNGNGGGDDEGVEQNLTGATARYHFRHESSGDEGQFLEMGMSKLKGASDSGKGKEVASFSGAIPTSASGTGPSESAKNLNNDADGDNGDATPYEAPQPRPSSSTTSRSKKQKGGKGKRARYKDDVQKGDGSKKVDGNTSSLVKLASTDDLLGRRMHGLAGGLTGLRDDE
ncbi:uncharacterized protein C8A04DRAFT_34895 [Dichotomopilus funicola]|uniref:Alpha/beta hydrolase fold-3 domain-containing protein n=1 Tax=Dichotomopilus funicola TaxID=1934379 RepID=A0AAN6ZQD2_9PEZI|nr:hypothetical protein C8A04DRAFT_34895 [Dichotomopilus funicola]